MIYDAENTFMNQQDLSKGTKSEIMENRGGGDAYISLWFSAVANQTLDSDATVTLKTGDKADMTDGKAVLTLTLPKGGKAAARLPAGMKSYMQAEVSGATTGTVTVALVMDVDL